MSKTNLWNQLPCVFFFFFKSHINNIFLEGFQNLFFAMSFAAGLCLSILLFVLDGMTTSPVNSVVDGQHVVSRTKRPWWEMSYLDLRKRDPTVFIVYFVLAFLLFLAILMFFFTGV